MVDVEMRLKEAIADGLLPPMISQSLAEFLSETDKEDEMIYAVPGWIATQYCYILSGTSGMGKSTLIYDFLVSIATGLPWMNHLPTVAMPVLLLDFENPKRFVNENIRAACKARDVDPSQLDADVRIVGRKAIFDMAEIMERPVQFNSDWVIATIKNIQEQTKKTHGVLIIDTMREAFDTHFEGQPDWEMKSSNIRKIRRMITEVLDATGWGCIGIHHNTKTTNSPAGSGDWEGAFDCLLNYTAKSKAKTSSRTLELTGRELDPPNPLKVTRNNGYLEATEKTGKGKGTPSPSTQSSLNEEEVFWLSCKAVLKDGGVMNKGNLKTAIKEYAKNNYQMDLAINWIGDMIDAKVGSGLQEEGKGNSKLYSLR